jgi:hypothetical protein
LAVANASDLSLVVIDVAISIVVSLLLLLLLLLKPHRLFLPLI